MVLLNKQIHQLRTDPVCQLNTYVYTTRIITNKTGFSRSTIKKETYNNTQFDTTTIKEPKNGGDFTHACQQEARAVRPSEHPETANDSSVVVRKQL